MTGLQACLLITHGPGLVEIVVAGCLSAISRSPEMHSGIVPMGCFSGNGAEFE